MCASVIIATHVSPFSWWLHVSLLVLGFFAGSTVSMENSRLVVLQKYVQYARVKIATHVSPSSWWLPVISCALACFASSTHPEESNGLIIPQFSSEICIRA